MYSIFFSKIDKAFNLIKFELKKIIKNDSHVVIIPWSFAIETDADGVNSFFSGKKKNKYVEPLLELGIDEKNIVVLNCYRDKKEEMIDKIQNSDILVLPGGNPEMFYNKVVECGIFDIIKNYNKIIIGESAGTELQLKNYFITAKNNYYKKFDWYKGFAIINNPFFMDIHSSNNYRYINKLQKVANEKKQYMLFLMMVLLFTIVKIKKLIYMEM